MTKSKKKPVPVEDVKEEMRDVVSVMDDHSINNPSDSGSSQVCYVHPFFTEHRLPWLLWSTSSLFSWITSYTCILCSLELVKGRYGYMGMSLTMG